MATGKLKQKPANLAEMVKWERETEKFPGEECARRFDEILKRCLGMKGSFDLEMGQPFVGEPFSDDELRRRGYTPGVRIKLGGE